MKTTLRETRKLGTIGRKLGVHAVLSAMGPFLLKDTQGMEILVCILIRSLDKGRYQDTLQYESVRKMRYTFSNVWYASHNTLTTSVLARDNRKMYVAYCRA